MQSHMQDHEQYSRDLNSNQTRIKSDDLGRCRYICIHTFKCPECLPCIACCGDLRLIHAYISMNRRSYVFLSMLLCSCCFLFELQAALGTWRSSTFLCQITCSSECLHAWQAMLWLRTFCGSVRSQGVSKPSNHILQRVFKFFFAIALHTSQWLLGTSSHPALHARVRKLNLMLLSHKGWSSIYARTGLEAVSWMVPSFAIICCHSASLGAFKLWRCDNTSS